MASRIGVVSDTHVPLRAYRLPPELLQRLRGVDLILHAGDLIELEVLEALGRIAPVTAVRGNVDRPAVKVALRAREIVEVGGTSIGLVHGDGYARTTLWRARHAFDGSSIGDSGKPLAAIVFGHSHQPFCQVIDGILFLNPGSPTDPRRAERPSFAFLHVADDGSVEGEHVYL